LGEIRLPARQAGSSIMPGKVNPVIPEAVTQAAMMAIGHDSVITMACGAGSLELNPYMPVIAECLLTSLDLLARGDDILRRHCVDGITVDEARCRAHVDSATAAVTALVPEVGYETAAEIAAAARREGRTIRDVAAAHGISPERFDVLVSPEAVCRLGSPEMPPQKERQP
jgi:aspartate ammonia-lyase